MDPAKADRSAPTLFSSDRERRLWMWTLAVVLGIYATLGVASTLAEFLYNQGLAAIAFLTCMLLVALTVLTQGLKVRPGGFEIGVAFGIAVVYFMLFFRTAIPERTHLIEYGVVAVFIYEALSERASQGRYVPVVPLLAIIATSMLGAIDEGIQWILPNRVFQWEDVLFNFLASLMAVSSMFVLGWARRLQAKWRTRKTS